MTKEEAIKIIESNCSCSGSKLREACAMFIPELREREDEKIRKGLIEALKTSKTVGELKFILPEPTREECIAYLEKQKEYFQTGKGLYYYDGEKTTYLGYLPMEDNPYDFAMSQQEKQKEQDKCPEYCVRSHCIGCPIYEKQKEQKPTEDWREKRKKECPFRQKLDNNLYGCEQYADVFCECNGNCSWVVDYPKLKEIQDRKEQKDRLAPIYEDIDSFESALGKAWKDYNDSGARIVDGCEDDYVECAHAKGFREGYLFGVEKQKDSNDMEFHEGYTLGFDDGMKSVEQKEQKPAEINEYEIIKKHITRDSLSSEVNKRLKECGWYVTDEKPVEWSEEDEYVIDKVIEWAKIVNPTSTIFEKIPKERFIERLKSLRPQPKQVWSKEDEKMLNSIINVVCGVGSQLNGLREKQVRFLKSLRPQPKQERQIKEGDKVKIHCRKDRPKDMLSIYNGKVGEVINVWDAKRNPWGHIGVRLDNGCNNGFYEDELEVLDESHWKPSEEQMNLLGRVYSLIWADPATPADIQDGLSDFIDQLKTL